MNDILYSVVKLTTGYYSFMESFNIEECQDMIDHVIQYNMNYSDAYELVDRLNTDLL